MNIILLAMKILAQTWTFENEINMDYGEVGWLYNIIDVDSENKLNIAMGIRFPFVKKFPW